MDVLIQIGQLLLSLSILIVLHEMGHFVFARLFTTRVEKFYLFFNPWFSLFKIKKGETEYGIGWLPLGGYVKISGMIDESMDKEQLSKPPQPYEFRSKPAWQRLLIMLGGVLVNFILALVIYIFILFLVGYDYMPTKNVTNGVVWDSLALEQGFQNGDVIVDVGGEYVDEFLQISHIILKENPEYITVNRAGEVMQIPLPEDFAEQMIAKEAMLIAAPILLPQIDSVFSDGVAYEAGLQKHDMILSINNQDIDYWEDVVKNIRGNAGKEINLVYQRNQDTLSAIMTIPTKGQIGIGPVTPQTEHIAYSFGQSIPAGIKYGVEKLGDYIKTLKYIFTKEGASKIGGFGTIGGLFPKTWNWLAFWELTAFLSLMLAFLNVMPIPALDGGHVLFLMYEMVTGRKPSEKFLEYAQIVGMVLLLALLLYANGNDVRRWLGF